ncbi:MAG: DUF2147 domain-containing protein [Chitinophagaceae bacterium]
MKYIVFIVTLVVGSFFQATAQQAILGKWLTPEKDGHIEIYEQANKFFGKIIWGKDIKLDENNPKPELRKRSLLGVTILNNFEYKNGQWINGTIYDPNNGKTYQCKMELEKGNKVLRIRGFIGFSLLGRTELFTRVE